MAKPTKPILIKRPKPAQEWDATLSNRTDRKRCILVAYDITNNRIRTRVYKTLYRYGMPTQYSFFTCTLTPLQFEDMRLEVADLIDPETDSVRYYELCQGCHRCQKTLSKIPPPLLDVVYVV